VTRDATTAPAKRPSTSPLTVLRHRSFATMWTASVVSDTGTWMQAITVGVLVARLTGKASSTGLVGIAAFATQGIGSPIGGVLADRFDRRKMFMYALLAQTAVTTVLAFALTNATPTTGVLAGLIAVQGLAGAFGMPAAQSLMPSLVPREELIKAVGLGAVSWNAGRILGAGLAALLGLWLSPAWIVVGNAATFAFLFFAISRLKGSYRAAQSGDPGSFLRQLRVGISTLWSVPGCRFALCGMVFLQLTLVSWVGLIPIVAQKQLHGTRGLASALITIQGAGAIIGAGVASWLVATLGRPRAIVVSAIVSSAALFGYALSKTRWVAFPFVFALGMASVGLFVSLGAMFQRDAPEHARARIVSIQSASLGICYGIGVLTAGRLADRFSLGVVHATNAVVFLVGVLLSVTLLRTQWAVVGRGDPRSRRWERRLEDAASTVRPEP
jgi:MFS family permease